MEPKQNQVPPQKEPIIIEKGLGIGWTLNWNRPESYFILAAILLLVVFMILFSSGVIHL